MKSYWGVDVENSESDSETDDIRCESTVGLGSDTTRVKVNQALTGYEALPPPNVGNGVENPWAGC